MKDQDDLYKILIVLIENRMQKSSSNIEGISRTEFSEIILHGADVFEDVVPEGNETARMFFALAYEAGFLEMTGRTRARLRQIGEPDPDVLAVIKDLDRTLAHLDAAERRRSQPPATFDGEARGSVVAFPSRPRSS